jgi:nitrile hydratase accessory protein
MSGSTEAAGFTGRAAADAAAAKAAVEAARAKNARAVNPEVAEMQGAEAPPRKNGELVFDKLWEGRTFGMAVTLSDQGVYPWRDFRSSLIDVISACDASGDTETPYYERFLAALEALTVDRGLVARDELDALTEEYAEKRRQQDAARAAADAEDEAAARPGAAGG